MQVFSYKGQRFECEAVRQVHASVESFGFLGRIIFAPGQAYPSPYVSILQLESRTRRQSLLRTHAMSAARKALTWKAGRSTRQSSEGSSFIAPPETYRACGRRAGGQRLSSRRRCRLSMPGSQSSESAGIHSPHCLNRNGTPAPQH